MKVDESFKKFSKFFEPTSGILEEIATLALLIRDTDSSTIAFALYRGIANREMAVEALKERLALPLAEFTVSARQKNPVQFLREISFNERGCILFFGLEDALPDAAGYLNFQREAFAEVPHAVVFWVTEFGLREIANKAPDFWAWRSGVFDFRSSTAVPIDIINDLTPFPIVFQDHHDLERRLHLYQELFREYSGKEDANEKFLAGLQLKQAIVYFYMRKFPEAEAKAREALDRFQEDIDIVFPLLILMQVAIVSGCIEEAESLAKKVLSICESLRPKLDVVVHFIFIVLGHIAISRNQLDLAELYYNKALEPTEGLSDERITAYAYKNLGEVAQQRGDDESANQWYQKRWKS
jgi:tetratricopeptide (TPR) repeat protein